MSKNTTIENKDQKQPLEKIFMEDLNNCCRQGFYRPINQLCQNQKEILFDSNLTNLVLKHNKKKKEYKPKEDVLKTIEALAKNCPIPKLYIKDFFEKAPQSNYKFKFSNIYKFSKSVPQQIGIIESAPDKENKSLDKYYRSLKAITLMFEFSAENGGGIWAKQWIDDDKFIDKLRDLTPYGKKSAKKVSANWQDNISQFLDYIFNHPSIELETERLKTLVQSLFTKNKDNGQTPPNPAWESLFDDLLDKKNQRETIVYLKMAIERPEHKMLTDKLQINPALEAIEHPLTIDTAKIIFETLYGPIKDKVFRERLNDTQLPQSNNEDSKNSVDNSEILDSLPTPAVKSRKTKQLHMSESHLINQK